MGQIAYHHMYMIFMLEWFNQFSLLKNSKERTQYITYKMSREVQILRFYWNKATT